jgi:hypothetical protein
VSLRAPRHAGNYAYVKFDALFKYLMNRSTLMQCLPHSTNDFLQHGYISYGVPPPPPFPRPTTLGDPST